MVRAVRTREQGTSLVQKIRHMKVDLFLDLLMPLAFFLSAVWFWAEFIDRSWPNVVFVVLWSIASILLVLRAICCYRNKSCFISGSTQQVEFAQRVMNRLDLLQNESTHVYHNIFVDGSIIDHLIISTRGIFTITMKIYNHNHGHKLVFRRGVLFFNGRLYDSLLRQMDCHSQCFREHIEMAMGKNYGIRKTSIVIGCYVENLDADLGISDPEPEYRIFNENAFFSFFQKEEEILPLEEVQNIVSKFEAWQLTHAL